MTALLERLDETTPPPRSHRWVRWLLLVACALLLMMWAYAFLWAPKEGVYRVEDAHWRDTAQQICVDANARRVQLGDMVGGYIAHPTQAQMLERADIVTKATDILDKMLNDIQAIPVPTQRDQSIVDTFLKYYRIIIHDRRNYIQSLRELKLEPYMETAEAGGPVTNIVTDFTSGNNIKACVPPGELGGDL